MVEEERMKNFLLKRILQMIFVFILVSMFAFAIIYFAPGDPLYMYTSPGKSSFKMSEEQLDALREDLGLTEIGRASCRERV